MNPAQPTWSGISPATLVSQIRSTVPFLFGQEGKSAPPSRRRAKRAAEAPLSGASKPPQVPGGGASEGKSPEGERRPALRYLNVLDAWDKRVADENATTPDHREYFELCLMAHFTTVGSFVPTDVDNQIRLKIWKTSPNLETTLAMAKLVEEFGTWSILPVAGRYVTAVGTNKKLSGLDGEWLGCAVGAYGALKKSAPQESERLRELILENLDFERQTYFGHVKAHDGIEVMKCATLIAHNLGDLDRVIDMWELPAEDPLRKSVYKAGHAWSDRFGDDFLIAGNLNKKFMAIENHRHFILREPKALRRKREYLLPVAPFFDDWGTILAQDRDLEERELTEILECLIKGYQKLGGAVAYARALKGFEDAYRGGIRAAVRLLSAKLGKDWTSGKLRAECSLAKDRFLEKWASYPFDRKNHFA